MPRRDIIETAGDLQSMAVAANTLVLVLRYDPRVRARFVEWRGALEAAGATRTPESLKHALRDPEQRVKLAERLVFEDLGLASYRWLPALILFDWGMTLVSELTVAPQLSWLGLEPDHVDGVPAGRAPGKSWRAKIARDVVWFYRARIQQARESEYELGIEWAASEGLSKKSQNSTVEGGIKNAGKLLGAFDVGDLALSRDTPTLK